jgi:hypothetical protein
MVFREEVITLVRVTTTNYSSTFEQYENEAIRYLENLKSKVSEQLDQEYQSEEDRKLAEISLSVCSKLLQAHLLERARRGKLPTG